MHSSRADFSSLHTQHGCMRCQLNALEILTHRFDRTLTLPAASPWGLSSEARFAGDEEATVLVSNGRGSL